MKPEHDLLTLLDPRKTTTPITSLPQLPAEPAKTYSIKSRAPTCSTKSSGSPENQFLSVPAKDARGAKEKPSSKPRSGDWVCLICGNHNYSFRESCNRCQKQTKACNLQQSLQIFENPALRNDLMKNESMAKRLEFNFCYSLNTEKPEEELRNTLNCNIVSGNGYPMPMSMVRPAGPFQEIPEYYFPRGIDNAHAGPRFAPNFMSGYAARPMQRAHPNFTVQSELPGNFSDYSRVNPVSPMFTYNINRGFQNFKKGTIKSDICHDKSFNQTDMPLSDLNDMQQNLVEKFKQMNLLPAKTEDKTPAPRPAKKDKENSCPLKQQLQRKFKTKQKRRGKLKYKAVELKENKKSEGIRKGMIQSSKPAPKSPKPMNPTKSVEELLEGSLHLPGPGEEDSRSREDSPKKRGLGSIFDSKLLFDFETPKKTRNDCFLNDGSHYKDSMAKQGSGFSKYKSKILRLFSQSDDEDETDFALSIEQMKKIGMSSGDRVF